MMKTGRLEVSGWFGAVASTHWMASQSAMGSLEKGGNAFDAAVVAGFVMQVAQPHFNGPAGDVAIMMHCAGSGTVSSVCGQGPTPKNATIDNFKALGLDHIPGTGLLPAVVPGAFDAWLLMLLTHGTITLREVLEPAILYAEKGVPIDQRLYDTLVAAAPMFQQYWPTSAALCLSDDGKPPPIGSNFRNPALATTFRRIVEEAEAKSNDRNVQIETARAIWSDGFVAQTIDNFISYTKVMDVSGHYHQAFLTANDMAGWRATEENTFCVEFAGHTIHKCGMWTQGLTLLQALKILDANHLKSLNPTEADFVHQIVEVIKLALADRDTHHGLSEFSGASTEQRIEHLLSDAYARHRRTLIGQTAANDFRPGNFDSSPGDIKRWIPGFENACTRQRAEGLLGAYGGGEPTIVYESSETENPQGYKLTRKETSRYVAKSVGDTSYLCVSDSAGNVVSATPSGGWLQSSPTIAELGFPLGTRAQMMWLENDSPSSLQPQTRPRSTLSPTIVTSADGSVLAVGTPGGDQQDQWQTSFIVRHLVHGMSLQEALDAPGFHTNHAINSFFPRGAVKKSLVVEDRFEQTQIDALRAKGHEVTVVGSWIEGRLCSLKYTPDGQHHAAATQRGDQSLAVAR